MRIAGVWLTCGLLVAIGPASAAGQDQTAAAETRAALLAAERERLATGSTPPTRGKVEKALYWYDNQHVLEKLFVTGWNGFHLAGGDFPPGAGLKFGVGFDHPIGPLDMDQDRPNRIDVTARAAYSSRGYSRVAGGLDVRNIAGQPLVVNIRSQYYEFPQEDFFGLGRDSREADRTDYRLDSFETGGAAAWNPIGPLKVGGGVWYLTPRIGRGTDPRFPSTDLRFDPRTIPGYVAQPDFVRGDVDAAYDWRDNPLHPHSGGEYGVRFSAFGDRDLNTFDFRRVQLEAQQYVPLPHRYRTLALRAVATFTDTAAGKQVPFFYQPTLGGSQTLRGFREFRFRDRNALALTAEYRWEAWWALDGALFLDAGTVAPTWRDLSVGNMDVSYGIGFRVHSNKAVLARLDLAFSREGFIPLLRFEHVF